MTHESRDSDNRNPFAALRRMARQATTQAAEHCDLCGEILPSEHRHLLNLAAREILCACRACVILLNSPIAGGGARRLIPTRCLYLENFELTDAQWESLQIPVNIAFFCYNSITQQTTAFYPSPMGPTESLLPLTTWDDLKERNPILQQMEPDVEALLVNRGRDETDCYLAPIDECYRLVGLMRFHWRGISGGSAVREEIGHFFTQLRERADQTGGVNA